MRKLLIKKKNPNKLVSFFLFRRQLWNVCSSVMPPALKSVSCRPWSYSANCFSTTGIESSGENEKNRSGVVSLLASLHYRLNGWVPRHCFPLLLPLANWEAENQSESGFTTTEPRKPGVQHKRWTITICVFLFFFLFAHTIPTSSVAAFPIHAMPNIRQRRKAECEPWD